MSDALERIRRLSARQRELLLRGVDRAEALTAGCAIPRLAASGEGPLSFPQQRLWFFEQLPELGGAYQIPLLWQLQGPLNVSALERSLQAVVDRHDVLRASFPSAGGQPRQHISPGTQVRLPPTDFSSRPANERSAHLHEAVANDLRVRFCLERGPLWRARLLRFAQDDHVLLMSLHHIVADGWSLGVLTNELAAVYQSQTSGEDPQLPELTIQYPDFAAWQQARWAAGEFEPDLEYWSRRLAGLTTLELPTDAPRPPLPSFRGDSQSLLLPRDTSQRLLDFCQHEQVTLFTALLAAFQVLMSQRSGQLDIAVGTPVAGRNRSQLEPLVGCFVNILVMRASLHGNPSMREFLAAVRATTLEAWAHQDVPFEKLVERLRPARNPARNPLVPVLFALHNAPIAVRGIPGLQVSFPEVESPTARFDLELNAWQTPPGIRLIATYNADLFHRATIALLLRQLQAIVEKILDDPNQAVSSLSWIEPEAVSQAPASWHSPESEIEEYEF